MSTNAPQEEVKDERIKQKYKIEGEFCPNCAAKMERVLSLHKDIGETAINYVAKTILLPPAKVSEAEEMMNEIEPGIKLVPLADKKAAVDDNPGKKALNVKLLRIIVSLILLLVGVLLESQWHMSQQIMLEYTVFLTGYILVGYEVLKQAVRNILRGSVFDENFLMSIATIGAIAIHQLPEAVGVMLFYSVGEYFQDRAVKRSRTSIQSLLDIRPEYANLITASGTEKVKPEDVMIGQQIMIRPGEKVPLDGEIIEGSSFLDTSALTGESVPRRAETGDTVLAGMINNTGVLTLHVIRNYAESSVQKILDLVENASARKARTEKFITTFARYYTPAVVVAAISIAVIPPLFLGGGFQEWLYRALTVLVISCPCALVISVPLGYFGGIGGASRQGILVKGANFLEALTNVKTVVFDKTGTLTEGVFDVTEIKIFADFSEEELLRIAAACEVYSSHPIAQSILKRYGKDIAKEKISNYEEIPGKGVKATFENQEIIAGKKDLIRENGISLDESDMAAPYGTMVYVANDGVCIGCLQISDRIKEGSKAAVQGLNQQGIETVMLTGDHQSAAAAIAEDLGLSSFEADLLPEDKVSWLERIMQQGKERAKTVFVGDGINDAPVLTRADIGVAMGGLGSDAAIEAADVVLMEDDPEKLLDALAIAKFTKKIIWQNISLALLIKLVFIILGIFGIATMWEAVFADVGVALLAILNATRVLQYSFANFPCTH